MNIKDKLKELPKQPGCYLMKNKNNEVIYVGKAKNLSNRVKSYFMGSHNAKTTRLVMDITDFEFIITSTEKEAFILEMNLIKKYRPRYNIMLMDDKMYPYIFISNEKNPRITYTRELNHKGKYFGPYPNSKAAKETVDMLNKIYPLRKCKNIPKKECLYYHINNCLGPCINKIDEEKYQVIINKIQSLLNGNIKEEVKKLKQKMLEASEALEYEKAMEYHNLIMDLEAIGEKQKMETSLINSDIFNFSVKDDYINIQVFQVRNTKVIERKAFTFDLIGEKEEMFIDFIHQFYLINNNPLPKEIIIPNIETNDFDEKLKNLLIIPKQGKRKELLDLVLVNIEKELENLILKKQRAYDMTLGAAIELAQTLGVESCLDIEAFDNSNIQGVSSVSAMVKYINGEKSTKDYRKYKVKTVEGSDDFNTFIEVLTRRYTRLKQENSKLPDLIIMDGGKTQVHAAKIVLEKLNLNINVLGLVKDENHRTDALLFNDKIITLDKKSSLFKFLTAIQDEVHRYAISFHHNTHAKKMISSKLDDIKGIGKVKKNQILSLLGEVDFENKLREINLNGEQIDQILKIYNLK